MPELPEVEVMRQYFNEAALHQSIAGVEFHDERDKIFKSSRQEISDHLVGEQFSETERIGKYLFAKISNGKWLHLHFGMTGDLEVFNDADALPKYTRFVIVFADGRRLAYRDLRKFGVIEITDSPEAYREKYGLGEDLLKISREDFVSALRGRKAPVKSALLDQKHFAGIGNWIADEMLFDCGIHPLSPPAALSEQQLAKLYHSAVSIVKEAIDSDTHYGQFPEHFFVNYRKKGAIHPDYPHSPVEGLKVGGRGTFIVPEKQQLVK